MLKITTNNDRCPSTHLRLEGKVSGPWVDTLAAFCASIQGSSATLDLAAVQFVDDAGRRLLRDLVARGFRVVAASGFVKELLHLEVR